MAGRDDITVEATRRRAWWPGRVLLAGIMAVALVLTAVVAFRWGSSGQPGDATAKPTASPKVPEPWSVAQIYEVLLPSVVYIRATGVGTGPATGKSSTGTGLVVNAAGTVLTALHVVQGATAIELTFADGTTSAAAVAAADPATDVAALTPATLPTVVVPAVLGGGPAVGDEVVAIGNQLGLVDSTTSGVVSGLDRSMPRDGAAKLEGLIQFDAAVNPGSSGGPLVNDRGQTIGIVVALVNPTDADTFIGVGFAVPIGTAVRAGAGRLPQL